MAGRTAEVGGSVGSTEVSLSLDASAADLNVFVYELPLPDGYDGGSGTWQIPINFSTGNHNVNLDEVWICHVDSSYSAKNTLGSETAIGYATNGGPTTRSISQGSSVSVASGDIVLIITAYDNGKSSAQSFGITPDSTITAPGTVVSSASDEEFAATSPSLVLPQANWGVAAALSTAVLMGGATDPTAIAPLQAVETSAANLGPAFVRSTYQFQYQAEARPIEFTAPAEEITVDKWYQDLSHDIAFRVQKIAERLFAGSNDPELLTQPEVTTPDKWFISFSEPVRSLEPLVPEGRSALDDSELLTQPEAVSIDKWQQPLDTPRIDPVIDPQKGLEYVGEPIAPPEEITLDKWYQQLSRPRIDPTAPEGVYTTDADALTRLESVSVDRWLQPLETVRIDPTTYPLGGIEYVGEPIAPTEVDWFPDKWYQQLSEPVQVVAPLVPEGQVTSDPDLLTQPEAVSIDKWLQALDGPRIDPFLYPQGGVEYVGEPITAAEEITPDKWYIQLSEPPAVKSAPEGYFSIDAEQLTLLEVTSIDKWWQPLSVPRIDPTTLPRGGVVFVGEPGDFPPPPQFFSGSPIHHTRFQYQVSSYVPVGEQIPGESPAGTVLHHHRWQFQIKADPIPIVSPETGPGPAALEWFSQLSEPIQYLVGSSSFYRPWLYTQQRDIFYVGEPISPTGPGAEALEWIIPHPSIVPDAPRVAYNQETVEFAAIVMPMDSWFKPLSEPVISIPILNVSGFYSIDLHGLTVAEVIRPDKWFRPLSEPLYVKARAAWFNAYTTDPTALIEVETIRLDKWYTPFTGPVRLIPQPVRQDLFWTPPQSAILNTGWRNFTSFANVDRGVNEQPWSNPSNAQFLDATYASATINNFIGEKPTDYLACTDMDGPAIPTGAVILGIQIRAYNWYNDFGAGGHSAETIRLTKNGTAGVGTNNFNHGIARIPPFPSPKYETDFFAATTSPPPNPVQDGMGWPSAANVWLEDSLWGATWTPAELNASTFGVLLAATADASETIDFHVDQVQVRVFYTLETFAEAITADKWFHQLSTPPGSRILPVSAVQSLVYEPEPILEIVTLDKWYQALSRQVLGRAPLPVGARQSFLIDPTALIAAETITIDKWFQALSRRPLGRPIVPAALAVSGANVYVTTLPPPLPIDTWFNLLSEPVRILPPLPRGAMQWLAVDPLALTLPEAVVIHKWILEPCPDGGWTIVSKPVPGWTKDGKPSPGWSKEC